MTLEEALRNLQQLLDTSSREKNPDAWDALKLGIEALEAVKRLRGMFWMQANATLPGETKE